MQVRIPNSELFARITELEARLHVYRSSSGVSSHAPKRLAPRTAPEAGRSLKNLSLVGDERIAMFLGKHNSAPTAGLDVATDVDFGPMYILPLLCEPSLTSLTDAQTSSDIALMLASAYWANNWLHWL